MKLIEHADAEMMAINLAHILAGDLRNALYNQERVLFVVPGGETPGPVFDSLCEADLDWNRVHVLLSDERWRPMVHVRSNTRLICERLLVGRAKAAQFVPLYKPAPEPETVLSDLEAGIAPLLPISVCFLGMGTDMHTASLLPHGDRLEEALSRDAPILVPMRVDDDPEVRVTLSARVLEGAVSLHIAITGQAKRIALERAGQMLPIEAPVAAVLGNATVHWAP